MFRMTSHDHRLSNGGLTDSHLPLDVPGGSLDLGYLRRVPVGHYSPTRVKYLFRSDTFHPQNHGAGSLFNRFVTCFVDTTPLYVKAPTRTMT